jgi:tRNA(Ile)-lysidine synthase
VDLKAQVSQTIDRYELLPVGDTVVVGVSGGVDSLCLLALLCELAPAYGVTLHVGHLNHLLRPEAAGEAITVRSLPVPGRAGPPGRGDLGGCRTPRG